jgi:hypothetical protein
VSQLPPDMVCNQHWPRPESARSFGRCHRLAESSSIRSQNLRVEGVYLGWHGTQYLPVISRTNEIDPQLQADFGAQLTTDFDCSGAEVSPIRRHIPKQ